MQRVVLTHLSWCDHYRSSVDRINSQSQRPHTIASGNCLHMVGILKQSAVVGWNSRYILTLLVLDGMTLVAQPYERLCLTDSRIGYIVIDRIDLQMHHDHTVTVVLVLCDQGVGIGTAGRSRLTLLTIGAWPLVATPRLVVFIYRRRPNGQIQVYHTVAVVDCL